MYPDLQLTAIYTCTAIAESNREYRNTSFQFRTYYGITAVGYCPLFFHFHIPIRNQFLSILPIPTFVLTDLLLLFNMVESSNTKTTSDGNSTIDQSSPYILHHSDNPGTKLVSKDLDGDNYSTWSRAMRTALSAKNKVSFIDGTLPVPESSSPDHPLWRRCNDMVKSWLVNSLSGEISDSVIYADNAVDIWKDLHERFSQGNAPRLFQLRKDITLCTQETLTVAGYFTKLKGYWDELSSLTVIPPCSC